MYGPGICSFSVGTFGHRGQKSRGWGSFICGQYIVALLNEKALAVSLYILALLGDNARARGFIFSFGTFSPFLAKMNLLPGSFVNLYILASFGKMYHLGVVYSQLVHFCHCGRKCDG